MPIICDQRPMRSEANVVGLIAVGCLGLGAPLLLRTGQPVIHEPTSPMTSQHQRDDSEGQRRGDGQPSKASQTAANRGAHWG